MSDRADLKLAHLVDPIVRDAVLGTPMEVKPEYEQMRDAIAHAFSRGERGAPHPDVRPLTLDDQLAAMRRLSSKGILDGPGKAMLGMLEKAVWKRDQAAATN